MREFLQAMNYPATIRPLMYMSTERRRLSVRAGGPDATCLVSDKCYHDLYNVGKCRRYRGRSSEMIADYYLLSRDTLFLV